VTVLTELDASAVRRWCSALAAALAAHQTEIDELNVYPVPDGDTGTNMALTAKAAAETLTGAEAAGASEVLQAMARGAVLGARGNSGVILSQILRGMAEANTAVAQLSADDLGRALQAAAARAYECVGEPVEGTILSVAKAVADAAPAAATSGLAGVARTAVSAARDALDRTPSQLTELARAGVVDAGGRGLVVVLEALCEVVTGEVAELDRPHAHRRTARLRPPREAGSGEFEYEVQYLLDAPPAAVAGLREALLGLGDSVAIVGSGEDVWNVHAHVNDVGAAIEAGLRLGRAHRLSVSRFADQAVGPEPGRARTGVAVVAVAPGDGLSHLFAGEGVHVVEGGPAANPSAAEVLAVVRECGAASVVLLPNATQVTAVAEIVADEARAEGIEVAVVPTRSPVQGLAAVAVYDPARRFGDLVVAMAETAAATEWAEVTVAVRDAFTAAGPCRAGDVLGLIGGDVVEIGDAVPAVAERVLDRLLGVGGELVTLLLGADADESLGTHLARYVAQRAPLVEATVFRGGQPSYPLLIGVE
jgi:DAK2 domain fusion protein YloV